MNYAYSNLPTFSTISCQFPIDCAPAAVSSFSHHNRIWLIVRPITLINTLSEWKSNIVFNKINYSSSKQSKLTSGPRHLWALLLKLNWTEQKLKDSSHAGVHFWIRPNQKSFLEKAFDSPPELPLVYFVPFFSFLSYVCCVVNISPILSLHCIPCLKWAV